MKGRRQRGSSSIGHSRVVPFVHPDCPSRLQEDLLGLVLFDVSEIFFAVKEDCQRGVQSSFRLRESRVITPPNITFMRTI